ncbi:MAG TPA: PfkB family carbohydrate kinase [Candidatus Limnocylindrales bacterium]|nr:PfkB family carbohydrate kinase [Candidatus Limnocylindrales bacterium]
MTIDVACVGSPFLDLIFRGLPFLPRGGEEVLARELVIVPGAIANVAYALNRLGLEAVVCAPVGRDPAGRLLGELMADAGIRWVGRPADATPVSVALPVDGDRAFVTAAPAPAVDLEALALLDPRAVVVDLPNVPLLPSLPIVYGVVGDPEVQILAGNLPSSLAGLRGLILNDREAGALAGTDDLAEAGRRLAALGTTVVVTCGRSGAFATEPDGRTVRTDALTVDVDEPTGAGDLFTAAYVWADLEGRPLGDRLTLATSYASLSLAEAALRPPPRSDGAWRRQKGVTLVEFELEMTSRERRI